MYHRTARHVYAGRDRRKHRRYCLLCQQSNKSPYSQFTAVSDASNYVAAHHQGITRKCDLARYFGVTRDAIYKFEHKPEIKSILEKYKNIVGIDPIKRLEHEMSEILSVLIECEPKSKTASTIKQLLKAIHDKKNTINNYGESSANC